MRPVVLLELDGIFVCPTAPENANCHLLHFSLDIGPTKMCFHLRPNALCLLRTLVDSAPRQRFGFWTSATHAYADAVLNTLFIVLKVADWRRRISILYARPCRRTPIMIKNIFDVHNLLRTSNIVLVDSNLQHVQANPGRALHVPKWSARGGAYATRDVFLFNLERWLRC